MWTKDTHTGRISSHSKASVRLYNRSLLVSSNTKASVNENLTSLLLDVGEIFLAIVEKAERKCKFSSVYNLIASIKKIYWTGELQVESFFDKYYYYYDHHL